MRLAGEICNREVVIALRDRDVRDAARLMRSHHVGDLVIVEQRDGENVPCGIVTDRDLVVEVIAAGVDADNVTIGDLVTGKLVTVTEDTGLWDLLALMRGHGVRRMPVVNDGGGLVGIVTLDDLLEVFAEALAELAHLVRVGISREQRTRP